MTGAEFIAELAASNPHLRQEDAELIVAAIFNQITAALARGERHSSLANPPARSTASSSRGLPGRRSVLRTG